MIEDTTSTLVGGVKTGTSKPQNKLLDSKVRSSRNVSQSQASDSKTLTDADAANANFAQYFDPHAHIA